MLDRLSVFAGGFGLEAAEEVANPGGELGIDSLEGISSLVDSNLVRATDQRTGEPRFALLETIRQFARERLSSRGEEFEIQARHARYFLALAEKAGPHLRSADQARWSDRLGHERDNLRAAVAWAVRRVTGFAPTSTIRGRFDGSRCENMVFFLTTNIHE